MAPHIDTSPQVYVRPETLEQALGLLGVGKARILAGGTDLYPGTEAQLKGHVLDITALPGMAQITHHNGLCIGACTTWTAIADADLPPALRALQQACLHVGGRQIQNTGTIGGNLCNASPAADGIPPLMVMDAQVELVSVRGTRHLALSDFLIGPRHTALRTDEVMTTITVSPGGLVGRSAFVKLGARAYMVISIAMVAARVVMAGDRIASAAIAVGACSGKAIRLNSLEHALIGASNADLPQIIHAQTLPLTPIDDIRASAAYRHQAAAELIHRAVSEAMA